MSSLPADALASLPEAAQLRAEAQQLLRRGDGIGRHMGSLWSSRLWDLLPQALSVRSGDEYEGWVSLEEVRWQRAGEADYGTGTPVVHVTSLLANVYREPNVTRHKPIVTVPLGSVLEIAAPLPAPPQAGAEATPVSQRPDTRWLMVVLPDRRPAWVQRGDVSPEWPQLAVPDLVSFAKRFLGVS